MPLSSDLSLNVSKFRSENISEAAKSANHLQEERAAKGPRWYEVGAAEYREMREQGQTSLPAPEYLPDATDGAIPSRDHGRTIPIRVYKPDNGRPSRGVLLHVHGGGFIIGSHRHSDRILQVYANECQLTAISVGYRLAPEHPHPAAVHDCIDAASHLAEHGRELYGAPLQFIAGESAGGCLALLCVFDFLRSHPSHHLLGLVLFYGYFDLALGLPSVTTSTKCLMTNRVALQRYCDAYLPGIPESERRDASISPLYQDLPALLAQYRAVLPPALFVCGSEDPLLDDTLLMSIKWNTAGGEAVVKVYPGAAHGFLIISGLPVADEAKSDALRFIWEKLQGPHGDGL